MQTTTDHPMLARTARASLSAITAVLALAATAAPALADVTLSSGVTLIIDNKGTLTGARRVLIDGARYDVNFRDGTCGTVFSGCNAAADFLFGTTAQAQLASTALMDDVLVEYSSGNVSYAFDSKPATTLGCTNIVSCTIFTPFQISASGVSAAYVQNNNGNQNDGVTSTVVPILNDFANAGKGASQTWAVWAKSTNVPEPASLALVGAAALAASATRRRRTPGAAASR